MGLPQPKTLAIYTKVFYAHLLTRPKKTNPSLLFTVI